MAEHTTLRTKASGYTCSQNFYKHLKHDRVQFRPYPPLRRATSAMPACKFKKIGSNILKLFQLQYKNNPI